MRESSLSLCFPFASVVAKIAREREQRVFVRVCLCDCLFRNERSESRAAKIRVARVNHVAGLLDRETRFAFSKAGETLSERGRERRRVNA